MSYVACSLSKREKNKLSLEPCLCHILYQTLHPVDVSSVFSIKSFHVGQAEVHRIRGACCRLYRSPRVCQSDCSVWFDRKWIRWKQDVATGVWR